MIFKPAARYPADPRAVFILVMSVFAGLAALALNVAPGSLHAVMPEWAVITWGILLTLGSTITIVGMARQTIGGIIAEQIGCVTVGATTVFYAGVAFAEYGTDVMQSVSIILAWGLSCGIRWIQLQILINNAAARAQKLLFLQQIEKDLSRRHAEELKRERISHSEHSRWRHL